MNTAWGWVCRSVRMLLVCVIADIALLPAVAESVSLRHAVELALAHSPAAAQASADEQRAFASYREARNQYIPQVVVGSGLGDTWGYPLSLGGSAPSLFNVTAQSALLEPSLIEFIKAARIEYRAISAESKDRRNQITEDTVLSYLELVKWEKEIDHLRQQQEDALKMEEIEDQRVKAGVDSEQIGKQAQLVAARAHLRITQAQGAIDVLRTYLSQLTGVPVGSFETAAGSVPSLPALPPNDDDSAQAAESNPAVMFAQDHALAQSFRARGEHRMLWPSFDFGSQYAVLAKFNNWLQFFPNRSAFQRNNATIGVVIRFPFLNYSQRAHAQAADAEAVQAKKNVESTKNQVSQQVLKLRRTVEQLDAAQKVSELEYEIAQANVDAVQIRMNSGTAPLNEGTLARSELSEKYNALQDSNFELLRARINLLRATGELDSWIGHSELNQLSKPAQ